MHKKSFLRTLCLFGLLSIMINCKKEKVDPFQNYSHLIVGKWKDDPPISGVTAYDEYNKNGEIIRIVTTNNFKYKKNDNTIITTSRQEKITSKYHIEGNILIEKDAYYNSFLLNNDIYEKYQAFSLSKPESSYIYEIIELTNNTLVLLYKGPSDEPLKQDQYKQYTFKRVN